MDFVLILDNIYDTFNVGGMYRVADAAGVTKIYHCGQTPTPPDPKILRASVGLVNYIPWEKHDGTLTLVQKLKKDGFLIIVLEQTDNSIPYNEIRLDNSPKKIALIAGNETFGVQNEIIKEADLTVELPMYGINKSLNVVVATGIVLYELRRKMEKI